MDLSTTYLGLPLSHPYMVGASPLAGNLDSVKRLEDAGSAAIVLHSLFEEQITMATRGEIRHRDVEDAEFATSVAHFPPVDRYALTPDGYLEHVRRIKASVAVPVIASLNGSTTESWMRFATRLEEAGADALEVNIYDVISAANRSSLAVETELRDLVIELKRAIRIPIAMKLSPYFTAFGHVAHRLDAAGADGLVIFNRFYQPDIDVDSLSLVTRHELSSASELRLRLQWAALLFGQVKASLGITGGVDAPEDAVKALLAGGTVVQMVSTILRHGIGHLDVMRRGLEQFMDARGFNSVADLRGRASLLSTSDPASFQRGAYIQTLHDLSRRATLEAEQKAD